MNHGEKNTSRVQRLRQSKVNYTQLIDKLSGLITGGMSPQDFTIKECTAVINAVLYKLSGHDEEKARLASFIKANNIALDFRDGMERVSSRELLPHTDVDFGAFVRSRHSVRHIIEIHTDTFFSLQNVHDCLIVTCDRALLAPAEMNDQEYINGGIFLGYLVLPIHAHGLGSCLFQFIQVDRRQAKYVKSSASVRAKLSLRSSG